MISKKEAAAIKNHFKRYLLLIKRYGGTKDSECEKLLQYTEELEEKLGAVSVCLHCRRKAH